MASQGIDSYVSDEYEGQRRYRHVQVGMELPKPKERVLHDVLRTVAVSCVAPRRDHQLGS